MADTATTAALPTGIPTTAQAASNAAVAQQQSVLDRAKFSGDFSNFLKLLTTQLTHQDPLSPLDTHQFTSQLVAFASVEQQLRQSSQLEQLVSIMGKNNVADAVAYLDKDVLRESQQFSLSESGRARLEYILPPQADNAKLQILDRNGSLVYESEHVGKDVVDAGKTFTLQQGRAALLSYRLPNDISNAVLTIRNEAGAVVLREALEGRGQGSFAWNGKDAIRGGKAQPGNYSYRVEALTSNSSAVRRSYDWQGFDKQGEAAAKGAYSFRLIYDLPEGSSAANPQYFSASRVSSVVNDATKGLLLALESGESIPTESVLAVLGKSNF